MSLAFAVLLMGLLIGFIGSVRIPAHLAPYTAVALLAAADSLLGGLRAALSGTFDDAIFVTGLVSNALLAALLAFVGDRIGINLYLSALVAFGVRIFQNLAIIRRMILERL
ncbi:MAG: hypothetical protein DDT35_00707 [Firmicutes bacterium]|nr:hypothetical protein [Bacillota bacterium]